MILWVTYRHLKSQGDLGDMWSLMITGMNDSNWWLFILVVMGMPINWLLESTKWQLLMQTYFPFSIGKAVRSILQGITLGIATPHRIGEYGGRILSLKPENNWKGITSTFVCSLAQNVTNVSFGMLATMLYLVNQTDTNPEHYSLIMGLGLGLFVLLTVCFLFIHRISYWVGNIITWHRIKPLVDQLHNLDHIPLRVLLKVLGLSILRFTVYFFQYYFLLLYFGFNVGIIKGFAGIGMIFLIQTGIPLPSVLSVAARGEIALMVWGASNGIGILAATFTLWIINLLIPAIIGLFFVFNTNILRSLGYEK